MVRSCRCFNYPLGDYYKIIIPRKKFLILVHVVVNIAQYFNKDNIK